MGCRAGTEISREAIDLVFLPTGTNVERGGQYLEFVLQQMQAALMALTGFEANDIVANSRKNPLDAWRRLQKRDDPTTRGRKRNLLRAIISPGICSLLELQAGIERWESFVSRYEKKVKSKLDDEIKHAGLEALVPEELEKFLILNSNRLRTFEDARLKIVTYVETKFGLTIRDARPGEAVSRAQSTLLRPAKGNHRWRVLHMRRCSLSTPLQCTQRQEQAIVWQRQAERKIMVQE